MGLPCAWANAWPKPAAGIWTTSAVPPKAQIGIQAIRGGDVVGVHTIYFMGPGERIEVTHQAHSRETFAQGALRAAAWLCGQQPGRLYGMQDIF